jgi:undecaprenyl-diphosphatase
VGAAFLVTGVLLFASGKVSAGVRTVREMGWKDALLIGSIQGMAITPGISRSGSTIAAAMFLGINRETAARYSFLLSVPAISGAFLLKLGDLQGLDTNWLPLLAGFTAAALSGYGALRLLLQLVKTGDFSRFCWYVWPLGAAALVYGLVA